VPTEQSWQQGDRQVMCFAHEEDPATLTSASVRGSGR
jgi:hypothetical protein